MSEFRSRETAIRMVWEARYELAHKLCPIKTRRTEEQLDVTSHAHLFDSCAQDSYTVFAILIHLLKTVKITNPLISTESLTALRSDGAGCYHSNNLIAALNEVHVHTGIRVLRYK